VERCKEEDAHQSSWDRTERALTRLSEYLSGHLLTEITRESILKIRKLLEHRTYKGLDADGKETIPKPLSKGTINRDLCALRSVLRKAAGEWKMLDGAAPKVPMFKIGKRDAKFVTYDQAEQLLNKLPPHSADMARMALATGMRRTNVTHMEWSRVDKRRRTYYVPSSDAKGKKRGINVPLNAQAMEVIKRWEGKHSTYVFCFRKRAPITQVSTRAWRAAARKVGLVGVTFHTMRHSWASWHVQNGTPLRHLQDLGGWASLEMPQRYSHLDPGHLARYADNSLMPAPRAESDTVENGEVKTQLSA
jgi:integrase